MMDIVDIVDIAITLFVTGLLVLAYRLFWSGSKTETETSVSYHSNATPPKTAVIPVPEDVVGAPIRFGKTLLSTTPTIDLLRTTLDGYEDIFGKKPDSVVVHRETRRAYVAEVVGERRYVNTMKYDNGEEALDYDGVPIFSKNTVPVGEVWALPVKPWEV